MCEPINPAPPVTSARLCSFALPAKTESPLSFFQIATRVSDCHDNLQAHTERIKEAPKEFVSISAARAPGLMYWYIDDAMAPDD
jgi:hypothetical protein